MTLSGSAVRLKSEVGKEHPALRRLLTTPGCLLMWVTVVMSQNGQAQGGATTTSSNKDRATGNSQRDVPATEPVSDDQYIGAPVKPSRWFSRVGFMVAPYHSSATIATNGQTLSGGTA